MDLVRICQKLLEHFGKQHWWPAKTKFEVIIGAILTQRATWRSAELAVRNLKKGSLLDPHTLSRADLKVVEQCVYPVGFYRQKAQRIVNISKHLMKNYEGNLRRFFDRPLEEVRAELLALDGIGKETADSMLLYAGNKLTFPVDAYTFRVCERLGLIKGKYSYDELRVFFENQLPKDLEVYKEFRALIVKLGKTYCKKEKPRCDACPLTECNFRRV